MHNLLNSFKPVSKYAYAAVLGLLFLVGLVGFADKVSADSPRTIAGNVCALSGGSPNSVEACTTRKLAAGITSQDVSDYCSADLRGYSGIGECITAIGLDVKPHNDYLNQLAADICAITAGPAGQTQPECRVNVLAGGISDAEIQPICQSSSDPGGCVTTARTEISILENGGLSGSQQSALADETIQKICNTLIPDTPGSPDGAAARGNCINIARASGITDTQILDYCDATTPAGAVRTSCISDLRNDVAKSGIQEANSSQAEQEAAAADAAAAAAAPAAPAAPNNNTKECIGQAAFIDKDAECDVREGILCSDGSNPEDFGGRCETSQSNCKIPPGETKITPQNCRIVEILNTGLDVITLITMPILVISLVYAGIKYSQSGGDPSAKNESAALIKKGVLALIVFIFMWSFLVWLIPGGFV